MLISLWNASALNARLDDEGELSIIRKRNRKSRKLLFGNDWTLEIHDGNSWHFCAFRVLRKSFTSLLKTHNNTKERNFPQKSRNNSQKNVFKTEREKKKRSNTKLYNNTGERGGWGSWIAWKRAASAQGETCFKSLSPPTPPTLISR
jgi:hypothetical protein